MKFLFILSVMFLASAQTTNIFTNIGESLKTAFATLGSALMHELDTTGVKLLNAGLEAGKTLVSQGVQALALNTANALKGQSTRDTSLYQQVESELHKMMNSFVDVMKGSFNKLVAGLKDIVAKVSNMAINPEEVITEVDKLVSNHNVIADSLLKVLESKAANIITSLIPKTKRNAFTDFFAGIGKSIASVFQPMVDGVKTLAGSAGTAIKTGASGLLSAAKESVAQLGTKLQPHIQALGTQLGTLVQHGSNALSALKAASGDILQQTLQNMMGPVNNMTGIIKDAGKTVVNHVAQTVLG